MTQLCGALPDESPLEEPLLDESDELPDDLLPDEDDDPEDEPDELDDDPLLLLELDELPLDEDEPDEELLDDDELEDDEPEDEPDELDESQHPSPSCTTSHLRLSAIHLAQPYVPAGTLSAVLQVQPPLDEPWALQISGQTTPIES